MVVYSHSKIRSFEQCPLKFKFKYIDNAPPDFEQTIEGFLGDKIHQTLKWLYDKKIEERNIQLDDLIFYFAENWKRDFKEKIKISNGELNVDYYLKQGIQFLINYFNSNYPFKDNTIATEKKIIIPLDESKDYHVIGYIDRLVHNKEENTFEIHDYKTGNSIRTQEELDKDKQLAIYCLGIKHIFKDVKEINLIWHFLAFNKKMFSKRTDEELENLKLEILDLIKKIESAKEFLPNPSPLCKWCEFQSRCPAINPTQKL